MSVLHINVGFLYLTLDWQAWPAHTQALNPLVYGFTLGLFPSYGFPLLSMPITVCLLLPVNVILTCR